MNDTNMSPNVWSEVKSDIELKILTGEYQAGERLPSIRKLAKDYGVGQSTAIKVLNSLLQEEIIETRRGVGHFVKPYIREKLIAERKRKLEATIQDACEEAVLIGVDLKEMVEQYFEIVQTMKK
jgi:GntR family transcriptional regulator